MPAIEQRGSPLSHFCFVFILETPLAEVVTTEASKLVARTRLMAFLVRRSLLFVHTKNPPHGSSTSLSLDMRCARRFFSITSKRKRQSALEIIDKVPSGAGSYISCFAKTSACLCFAYWADLASSSPSHSLGKLRQRQSVLVARSGNTGRDASMYSDDVPDEHSSVSATVGGGVNASPLHSPPSVPPLSSSSGAAQPKKPIVFSASDFRFAAPTPSTARKSAAPRTREGEDARAWGVADFASVLAKLPQKPHAVAVTAPSKHAAQLLISRYIALCSCVDMCLDVHAGKDVLYGDFSSTFEWKEPEDAKVRYAAATPVYVV